MKRSLALRLSVVFILAAGTTWVAIISESGSEIDPIDNVAAYLRAPVADEDVRREGLLPPLIPSGQHHATGMSDEAVNAHLDALVLAGDRRALAEINAILIAVDTSEVAQNYALQHLASWVESQPSGGDRLLAYASDESLDPSVRAAAVFGLGRALSARPDALDRQVALRLYRNMLSVDTDPDLREAAIRGAILLNAVNLIPDLRPIAIDPAESWVIRVAAVDALAGIGDEGLRAALQLRYQEVMHLPPEHAYRKAYERVCLR